MDIRARRESVEVFCCYAREDQPLLLKLKTHLTPLHREGLITLWADTNINAGVDWEKEIHLHLNTAQIILLLISPDFTASEYCYSVEMQRAMERHTSGEAHVIPIILRPVSWQGMPFGTLQALPTSAKPITSGKWHDQDEAFYEVVEGIRAVVAERAHLAEEKRVQKVEEESRPSKPALSDRDRFDKWTERARKVLSLAQEEAQRFQHNYIATEHLLLGLVREGGGVAAKVLANLDVEPNKVRSAVEFIIGRGDHIVLGEVGLTPRAKKVIELAVDEARRLKHHYVGTEHLLLGLVREGESIAAGVLESLGVNLEKVRTQTMLVLGQPNVPQKPSKTPTVDRMGMDLTATADTIGELSPIIGRHQEMDRITQILCRRNKNNPVLVGEPGVGKTTIVKGLARRIVRGEVPQIIAGKRLLTLDLDILSGTITKWRDEAEQQLQKILEEVHTSNDCILILDNLSRLFGTKTTERMLDAVQLFKSALSSGKLQCLGTCTSASYESMIKQDVALQAWFEKVQVGEMTVEETIEVLEDVRKEFERHYRLVINDEALKTAAELACHYISDRSLPSKAIALLDETASQVSIQSMRLPLRLKESRKGLESALREKEAAIQQQEYELAAELREREIKIRERIAKQESDWQSEHGNEGLIVDGKTIVQIVSAG